MGFQQDIKFKTDFDLSVYLTELHVIWHETADAIARLPVIKGSLRVRVWVATTKNVPGEAALLFKVFFSKPQCNKKKIQGLNMSLSSFGR